MPRESVLTAADRNQIRIEKLIFHMKESGDGYLIRERKEG